MTFFSRDGGNLACFATLFPHSSLPHWLQWWPGITLAAEVWQPERWTKLICKNIFYSSCVVAAYLSKRQPPRGSAPRFGPSTPKGRLRGLGHWRGAVRKPVPWAELFPTLWRSQGTVCSILITVTLFHMGAHTEQSFRIDPWACGTCGCKPKREKSIWDVKTTTAICLYK